MNLTMSESANWSLAPAPHREASRALLAALPHEWDRVGAEPMVLTHFRNGRRRKHPKYLGVGFTVIKGNLYVAFHLLAPDRITPAILDKYVERVRHSFVRAQAVV